MATPGVDPQHRVREHLEAHPDRLRGLRQGMVGPLMGPRSAPAAGPATVSAAQSRGGAATATDSGSGPPGRVELAIPRLRRGSSFPGSWSPAGERAMVPVVARADVAGVEHTPDGAAGAEPGQRGDQPLSGRRDGQGAGLDGGGLLLPAAGRRSPPRGVARSLGAALSGGRPGAQVVPTQGLPIEGSPSERAPMGVPRDASRWGPQAGFVGPPRSAQTMDPIHSSFDLASAGGADPAPAGGGAARGALLGDGPAPRRGRSRPARLRHLPPRALAADREQPLQERLNQRAATLPMLLW